MAKKIRLKCRFCLTEFDWTNECKRAINKEDMDEIAIVCPGDEEAMIASHVEIVKSGHILKLEERFWILKEN